MQATPVPSSETGVGFTPSSVNNTAQPMSRAQTHEIIGSPISPQDYQTAFAQPGRRQEQRDDYSPLSPGQHPTRGVLVQSLVNPATSELNNVRQDTQPHVQDTSSTEQEPAISITTHTTTTDTRANKPRPQAIVLPDLLTPRADNPTSVPGGPRMPTVHHEEAPPPILPSQPAASADDADFGSPQIIDPVDPYFDQNNNDDSDDDDILNKPGLRVSGLFGITFIVSVILVVGLWQSLGSNFTAARLRSDAVESGNHLASVAIRWASLTSNVVQRINMTEGLFDAYTFENSASIATLVCNMGAFELNAIAVLPIGVDNPDAVPIYCQDTQPGVGISAVVASIAEVSNVSVTSAPNSVYTTNASVAITCSSMCPNKDNIKPHNTGGYASSHTYTSLIDRIVYDQRQLRADLSTVYPLINFTAPSSVVAKQIARAYAIDSSLFNVRVFPSNPTDLVIFTLLRETQILFVAVTRNTAYSQIFGFDNSLLTDDSSVVQPYRFSSTSLFVENVVPNTKLFAFRETVRNIAGIGHFPYRPYVGPNLSAVLSTDTISTNVLTGASGDSLVQHFFDTCAAARMPSRYSTYLDYTYRIMSNGWEKVDQLLPNAAAITPGAVSYTLQITPFAETVVTCGQVCQVPVAATIPDYLSATGDNVTLGTELPSECLINNGQRIFLISYATDSATVITQTEGILNIVGWVGIAVVIVVHVIMYSIVAVPIRYLRSRVLCTLQERQLRFALARHLLVKLTRRFWLGEVRSLANAVAVIVVQSHENNRFVPDYVKRRQHNENLMVVLAEADRLESYQVATGAFATTAQGPGAAGMTAVTVPTTPIGTGDVTPSSSAAANQDATGQFGLRTASMGLRSASHGLRTTSAGRSAVRPNQSVTSPLVPTAHNNVAFSAPQETIPMLSRGTNMALVPSATVLMVSLRFMEAKYMTDFNKTETAHLKIVAALLAAFRKHRGEPFGRDGIVGGATWNAFEPDAHHVLHAVQCAIDVAAVLKPIRDAGHNIGIAVHTGPLISGVVGDAFSVAHVVIGKIIAMASHLAELNRQMSGVSMLVTQPVRQATNIFHEYLAVDAVLSEEDKARGITPTMLFDVRAGRSRSALEDKPVTLTAVQLERLAFAEKYNSAFAQFRVHDFAGALATMNDILRVDDEARRQIGSPNFDDAVRMPSRRTDLVFARLYRLCTYYSLHPKQLPKPYIRLLPAWHIYETKADTECDDTTMLATSSFINAPAPSEDLLGQTSSGNFAREPTQAASAIIVDGLVAPGSAMPTFATNASFNMTPRAGPATMAALEASFRTQLAQAVAQRRGHKRTDSGQSQTGGRTNNTTSAAKASPQPQVDMSTDASLSEAIQPGTVNGGILVQPPTPSSGTSKNERPATDTSSSSSSPNNAARPGPPLQKNTHVDPSMTSSNNESSSSATTKQTEPRQAQAASASPQSPNGFDKVASQSQPSSTSMNPVGSSVRLDETLDFANSSFKKFDTTDTTMLRWGGRKPAQSVPLGNAATLTTTQRRKLAAQNKRGDAFNSTGLVGIVPNTPAAPPPNAPAFELITECGLTDDCLTPLDVKPTRSFDPIPEGELTDVDFMHRRATQQGYEDSFAASVTDIRRPAALPLEFTASNGSRYKRSTQVLGRGTYGTVLMGMETHSGRIVALKVLPLPQQHDPDEFKHLANEVEIMQRVRDQNVVEFYGHHIVGDHILLIMEYVSAGSLDALLGSFKALSTVTTVNYLRDILHGLVRLHSEGIIHRDVKPQNVLVTTAGVCKLTDFGASALLSAMARGEGTVEGTPLYLSPEAARGHPQFKSDVWAIGIMFLQLISGSAPYHIPDDMTPDIFVFQVGSGLLTPTWSHIGLAAHAEEFVRSCLEPDPDRRSSAADLLTLPFFTVSVQSDAA